MNNKENMENVLNEVKNVDSSITKIIVPLLEDTIADGNRHNKRLFVLIMIELFIILAISITALFLVYKQNVKYDEFLSQFEFGEELIYQDVDAGDGSNSIINDGIKINDLGDK